VATASIALPISSTPDRKLWNDGPNHRRVGTVFPDHGRARSHIRYSPGFRGAPQSRQASLCDPFQFLQMGSDIDHAGCDAVAPFEPEQAGRQLS